MLLRRITQHVKDQNWFAVLLDFIIVVAGILIAFQITNWNETRKDRADEIYYLNRIIADIDESITRNDDVIAFLDSKTDNAYWVAEKLRSGHLTEAEKPMFNERFLAVGDWRTGDFIDSTILELQSNGSLDIIESKKFHEQLGRFQLSLQEIRRGQLNIQDFHKALELEILARADRSSNPDGQILRSSFEELAQQTELHRYIERYAFFYNVRRGYVDQLQNALKTLGVQTREALEEATN